MVDAKKISYCVITVGRDPLNHMRKTSDHGKEAECPLDQSCQCFTFVIARVDEKLYGASPR